MELPAPGPSLAGHSEGHWPGKRLAGAVDNKGPVENEPRLRTQWGASAQANNSSPQKPLKTVGRPTRHGIDVMCSTGDLKAQPKETACWDGVHDSEAQNFLGAMKPSSIATVKNQAFQDLTRPVREASPDHTQFEKNSPHYDPSSKKTIPHGPWWMSTELKTLRQAHRAAGGLLKNRAEFDFILRLEEKEPS
ncbi:unnamed protein product [Nyctereutes procyonoides]|uniref:Thymocyte nuclear protein 1 n=1 Tax=Nyctereutes procyonoides TaxID=34880 RepID=A0A811Y2C2_NYCPR|nr:unnamed protein product [Nyctereutes procyonoides]